MAAEDAIPSKPSIHLLKQRKVSRLKEIFNVPLMIKIFNITEDQILFSSRSIPTPMKTSDPFKESPQQNVQAMEIIDTIEDSHGPIDHEKLKEYHDRIVSLAGKNSQEQKLFLRHIRNYFKI